MAGQANQIGYNTNSPSLLGDTNFWNVGDLVYNNAPLATKTFPSGWICVASGYPGTWSAFTLVPAGNTLTTTATSGTLTATNRITLLNPATTGTYSLPDVTLVGAGTVETFKNVASGSVTLTALATNSYADAAAITLAQFAVINLMSVGTTLWYKAA